LRLLITRLPIDVQRFQLRNRKTEDETLEFNIIMFKKLRNGFFTGVALLLPAVLTIIIIKWAVTKLDNLILEPLVLFIRPLVSNIEFTYLLILIKGFLFLLIILLIALIGLAAKNMAVRRLFSFWERLLFKVPFISKVYITIKQISSAFLGEKRHIFQRVVLVEYPRKGLYCLGFVTSSLQSKIQNKLPRLEKKEDPLKLSAEGDPPDTRRGFNRVNVFIPTTPNPTSGFLLIVPEEDVIPLDISVEEGMKLVISGGVI